MRRYITTYFMPPRLGLDQLVDGSFEQPFAYSNGSDFSAGQWYYVFGAWHPENGRATVAGQDFLFQDVALPAFLSYRITFQVDELVGSLRCLVQRRTGGNVPALVDVTVTEPGTYAFDFFTFPEQTRTNFISASGSVVAISSCHIRYH